MRNVILIGAGCSRELAEYLCTLGVPVLTSWQGIDLVPEDSPVFCGRPGVIGQRAANIIIQKAEALYVFGARLDPSTINYNYDTFAPNATKYVFDVDAAELHKYPPEWRCEKMDLMSIGSIVFDAEVDDSWLEWCKALCNRFRPELDGNPDTDYVDPYLFVRYLSDACKEDEIIVPASSGMQSCALMQAFKVKRGQRILLCNTIGAMGFEPMAIGAAVAIDKRVIVVSGDGGFALNMQELEVVKRLGLNIKYFVFENGGYGSITTMQDNRFGLRVASDRNSGFTTPNLYHMALMFGCYYGEINSNSAIADVLEDAFEWNGPTIIRVRASLEFRYACKVEASLKDGVFINDDLSDMTPKIDDYERIMSE